MAFDEPPGPLARGECEARQHAAQIFAFLEADRSAVDFGDVADDREAEACSGLAGRVESSAAGKELAPTRFGNSGSVVLNKDVGDRALGLDGHEHPSAAIFRGILDQVAEHFVEVLALDPDLRLMVAGDVDRDAFVESIDGALDSLQALPHRRA